MEKESNLRRISYILLISLVWGGVCVYIFNKELTKYNDRLNSGKTQIINQMEIE